MRKGKRSKSIEIAIEAQKIFAPQIGIGVFGARHILDIKSQANIQRALRKKPIMVGKSKKVTLAKHLEFGEFPRLITKRKYRPRFK